MKILAIDPGYKMGYAIFDNGKLVESNVLDTSKYKDKNNRFFEIGAGVSDIIDIYSPDIIIYEHVRRWMSSDAALAYNGCLSHILGEAWSHNIPTKGYAVTSIKKHATGSGKATKEEMIAKANELYSIQCKDDNEADAVLVGHLAISEL